METSPDKFDSRDAEGLMDPIIDLMDDENEVFVGPPGSSRVVMVPIKHVGTRPSKTDNVAGSGLTWNGDETHLVPDDKALILLRYPDVWTFDKAYLDSAKDDPNLIGLIPVTVHITTADFEAVANGEAELMVVHHADTKPEAAPEAAPEVTLPDAEGDGDGASGPTLNEELDALDKDGLIDFAAKHDIKLEKRMGEDKMREKILAALAGAPE